MPLVTLHKESCLGSFATLFCVHTVGWQSYLSLTKATLAKITPQKTEEGGVNE
jgi:hypothetical protein